MTITYMVNGWLLLCVERTELTIRKRRCASIVSSPFSSLSVVLDIVVYCVLSKFPNEYLFMALRILQFGIVFAIGYYLGPASSFVGAIDPPEIPLSIQLKDPKDVTVCKGQSATLRCEVKSLYAGIQVTWLHNNNPITNNDTRRYMRHDGSLYFPKIGGSRKSNSLTGEYRCRASAQSVSVLSNPATLKIASLDRDFNKQPSNLSVPEFQPAVFFCNIHSVPAAQIKWEQNTKPLPHNTRYVPLPTGALLITKTHSSDAGLYRCIATNSLLKKTKRSKIVQLTVSSSLTKTVAPTILPLDVLPNSTVLVGENVNLYCAVTGWPIPTVQWLHNDSIVIRNSSVLQLRNASLSHAGNYSCIASVSGRLYLIQNYTVVVYQKPYFNVTPTSKTYPSARTVRLECQAKGLPNPKIYWLKNGLPLPNEARIKKQSTGLIFSHTFTSDSGIYQCVAVNVAGKIWAAAQLVQTSSDTPSPPENVQCRSFDETSICLTWQQPENVSVTAYSIYSFYTAMGLEIYGPEFVTNKTQYLASGLNGSTNYTFYVRLYSRSASDQSQRVVCETGLKGNRNLIVIPINESSVQLQWSKVSTDVPCDGTKEFYKIQWKRKDRSSSDSRFTGNFTYIISGLTPSVEYEARVVPTSFKNDHFPWISFTTSPNIYNPRDDENVTEVKLVAPERLEGSPVSATSINLTWADPNKNTKYYSICLINVQKRNDCDESNLRKSVSDYLQINNLQPDTPYAFKVKAHSYTDFSAFSESKIIRTLADVPSEVLNLDYEVINETTACLHWKAPLRKNGKLTRYLISYFPDDNWSSSVWINKSIPIIQNKIKDCWSGNDKTFSALLVDLEPEKQYTLMVRAASEAGLGSVAYPIKLNTNKNFKNIDPPKSRDNIKYNQKLGIIMGITLSFICIIFCVSCILVRKRCLKHRAFARARMAASNNYYPAVAHYASEGNAVQVRLENSCSAEIHEIEHLVTDNSSYHIPAVAPAHLDTKGCDGFPNGHVNGSGKPYINGHIANGIVHITENPRYYAHECNGNLEKKPRPHEMFCSPYEEDSNSNLKTSKLHDLHRIFERTKTEESPEITNYKSTNNLCNFRFRNSASKLNDDSKNNLPSKDIINASSSSSHDSSLNTTQISCLDNSLIMSVNNHRKVSPLLDPNG